MINLANSPPPQALTICDKIYPIRYDFLTWIDVYELLIRLDTTDANEEATKKNIQLILEMERLVFGEVIDAPAVAVVNAIAVFYAGYPMYEERQGAAEGGGGFGQDSLFSFREDLNYILLAIRNQSGIDLTYKGQVDFHWWLFLLEFTTLEEHHHICKIMQYRTYEGDDKQMLKLKAKYALPRRYTAEEQRVLTEFDSVFYNT
mgnify:CR=1 FL=1|jgi:hypothetical protein